MSGDTDRSAFLMLSLDDRARISFSGSRYYRLEDVSFGEAELEANLVVDTGLGKFASLDLSKSYIRWLDSTGMSDPVYDTVILPYYEVIVCLRGGEEYWRTQLLVKPVRWSNNPRMRLVCK